MSYVVVKTEVVGLRAKSFLVALVGMFEVENGECLQVVGGVWEISSVLVSCPKQERIHQIQWDATVWATLLIVIFLYKSLVMMKNDS